MTLNNTEPTYNLKAVIQETGIKADTLRAWERRYGLPTPTRTSGGHRLFTQRDIETVKWLQARQEEGLSISRAVDLWRSIEADQKDPLLEMDYPSQTQVGVPLAEVGNEIAELRSAWIDACKRFDEQAADQILNQAFALFPPEVVCLDLITKALSEIGEGWYQSEVTVQQEHFASEQATRRIEALIAAAPQPSLPGRVLILCPPGEEHTFSPLLITFLIKRSGREATFLGANVPLNRLDESITATSPRLVILSAQQLHTAAALHRMALHLKVRDVPVAYGGRIFNLIPDLQRRIPGTFLGQQLRDVPGVVDRLVRSPALPVDIEQPPDTYEEVRLEYLRNQAQIDAYIVENISLANTPYNHIALANLHLGQNIEAALELGEISYLGEDISWVRGLLGYHSLPEDLIDTYIDSYIEALKHIMGDRGSLISDYLDLLSSSVDLPREVR